VRRAVHLLRRPVVQIHVSPAGLPIAIITATDASYEAAIAASLVLERLVLGTRSCQFGMQFGGF
jgi:hypothetical protein